jgi:hypothetical protein
MLPFRLTPRDIVSQILPPSNLRGTEETGFINVSFDLKDKVLPRREKQ